MGKDLVMIKNNDLFIGTWDMSEGTKVAHRYLKEMIEKYKSEFEEFGEIKIGTRNRKNELVESSDLLLLTTINNEKKRGRQIQEYIINEEQAFFLMTLCKNSDFVMIFKKKLTKEFFRMRKVLIKLAIQKENEDWHERRKQGIIERRVETDAIKDFIEYAIAQGSQSAKKYYMVISKMENQSLLHLELMGQKFDNTRDMIDGFNLDALKMCDRIVAQAIRQGIKDQMHYKDIYQLARDRVEAFSLSLGKTPMRLLNLTQPLNHKDTRNNCRGSSTG